jgi:hypothetical protein
MILGENIGSVYSNGREIQRVFSKGKLVWEKENYSIIPFTVKALVSNVSIWISTYEHTSPPTVRYSKNGGDWTTKSVNLIKLNNKGDTVSITSKDLYYVEITGKSEIYGNVMSLLYGDNFKGQTVWTRDYSQDGYTDFEEHCGLFQNSDITSAENLILPARTLSDFAYANMFRGCSLLTIAPKLPATNLSDGCYMSMFKGCSLLTTAPYLPASVLKLYCYGGMFLNCRKLNYVKCNATSISINNVNLGWRDCFLAYDIDPSTGSMRGYKWLENVSSSGTFVCKKINGGKNPIEDYIPSTWTVEYLD